MKTYRIIRFYADGRAAEDRESMPTLEDAQEHCRRADTSSRTHPKGLNGESCEWFDSYIEE